MGQYMMDGHTDTQPFIVKDIIFVLILSNVFSNSSPLLKNSSEFTASVDPENRAKGTYQDPIC